MTDVAVKSPLIPVLERRRRALTYLAIATGVAVLLAILSLWQRGSSSEPAFKPVRMFPGIEAKVDDIATIQIETKAAAFNVTRDAKGQWHLPDKSGYSADFNTVRKTILGLAELDLVEPRTNRADWQEKLGLSLPKSGGTGTLVTLKDSKGDTLASLIAGNTVEGAAAGGKQAIYVRRPDEPQTYVARGTFQALTDQAQWLDKAFFEVVKERIKSAAVRPLKNKPYSIVRATPEQVNFTVVDKIPAGRMLRSEGEANGLGFAILGLSFDDVVPATKVDFTNAVATAYQTFDGLNLTIKTVEKDRDYWITVEAAADPNVQPPPAKPGATALKPDVAKEAKEINAALTGWAYKIPRYKGVLMTAPLEDMLRPIGGEPTPPPR